MFGAIYIGMSGLSAYSKGLQTVSNNVSNMNTSGFKASNVTFSDVYGGGSNGGLEYGYGSVAVGHGVTLNDINVNFGQGELRQTDRDLDLAVEGNGFFVLQDGDQTFYARTGSFAVDDDGYIILSNTKMRLSVLDANGRTTPLNIDEARTNPPKATDIIKFADNLSSSATEYSIPDLKVYDQKGTESIWTVKFLRNQSVPGSWSVSVSDALGKQIGTKELKFNAGTIDPATSKLTFEDSANNLNVEFDFSANVTSFSSGVISTLRASEVSGHPTGTISTLTVNQKGQLEVSYTNEEKKELGAIALADFRDPQQLEQRSNGLFRYDGYGQRQLLSAEDTRVGSILSKRLEASNVDLGGQFGELILIQRGFQASSQIISVSNDMIQQLFGIRGQG
jgi:flagellar hook protein FlgE